MVVSTSYFPSIQSIAAIADGALIQARESFQKHSDRNRCRVMTSQGVKLLTVPIVGGRGVRASIDQVEVDYSLPFQREHLRTITTAYRSAAYYDHFIEQVEPLFSIQERYLFDLNCRITEELLRILRLDSSLHFTEQFGTVCPLAPPSERSATPYFQVFADRQPFAPNLSVLDWIFCCGYWC